MLCVADFAAPFLPSGVSIKAKEVPGCEIPMYDIWAKEAGQSRGKWQFRIAFPQLHMRADTEVKVIRTR